MIKDVQKYEIRGKYESEKYVERQKKKHRKNEAAINMRRCQNESAIRTPFQGPMMTAMFIFHHRFKFHFASRVTLKVEPAIEVWLARYRYDGWNRISALIWFRCQRSLKPFLCLIWYSLVGRSAFMAGSLYFLCCISDKSQCPRWAWVRCVNGRFQNAVWEIVEMGEDGR